MNSYSKELTASLFKKLVDSASNGGNASLDAFMINMFGDEATVEKFFAVGGMIDLMRASLPQNQHSLGHLNRYSN